jgi:hypothetical protein
MITDSNQVCFVKMAGRRIQEGVLILPKGWRSRGQFSAYTYLSAVVAGFRNQIFPIEIIGPDKYMKIKSTHFWWPENSTSIIVQSITGSTPRS